MQIETYTPTQTLCYGNIHPQIVCMYFVRVFKGGNGEKVKSFSARKSGIFLLKFEG